MSSTYNQPWWIWGTETSLGQINKSLKYREKLKLTFICQLKTNVHQTLPPLSISFQIDFDFLVDFTTVYLCQKLLSVVNSVNIMVYLLQNISKVRKIIVLRSDFRSFYFNICSNSYRIFSVHKLELHMSQAQHFLRYCQPVLLMFLELGRTFSEAWHSRSSLQAIVLPLAHKHGGLLLWKQLPRETGHKLFCTNGRGSWRGERSTST